MVSDFYKLFTFNQIYTLPQISESNSSHKKQTPRLKVKTSTKRYNRLMNKKVLHNRTSDGKIKISGIAKSSLNECTKIINESSISKNNTHDNILDYQNNEVINIDNNGCYFIKANQKQSKSPISYKHKRVSTLNAYRQSAPIKKKIAKN